MHAVFKAMAEYNRNVNEAVLGHLEALGPEQFGKRLDAYYPTIPATLLHVMSSDAKWLGRFSGYEPDDFDSAALAEFKQACERDPAYAFAQRGRLFGARRDLDGRIVALLAAMEGADLAAEVTIPFGSGQLTLEAWKLLLQWFNHQTHHRGQVSLFLDVLGVENDFSKVIDKIS